MGRFWKKSLFVLSCLLFITTGCKKKTEDTSVTISQVKPSFAVRGGMACTFCHATVSSNVFTDFGLQVLSTDPDLYTGTYWYGEYTPAGTQPFNAYTDSKLTFKNGIDLASDKTLYVPTTPPPQGVLDQIRQMAGAESITNFVDYVTLQFSTSSKANTKKASVKGVSSLYIGAPTKERIEMAFFPNGETITNLKFNKSTDSAPAFSGLSALGTGLTNTAEVVCEGDLFINVPLKLDTVTIKTDTGCRIYSTSSVFIYGPITYASINGTSTLQNLQITSSRSINLGLGLITTAGDTQYPTPNTSSSLTRRYAGGSNLNNYGSISAVRGGLTPTAFANLVKADANVFGSTLIDAYSHPAGRDIAFEKIILNAPAIHSRYSGAVKGVIIAEMAIMALSNFPFQYDSIFDTVPIFTQLGGDAEMLRITE